jgi:hypothetical protein
MSDKIKKIYHALVEGAENGLTDKALFKYVVDECPKATSKKIVKASLLALSDDELKDAQILKVIYDLAIKHRLDAATADDAEEHVTSDAPKLKKAKAPGKNDAAAEATA